MDVRKVFGFLLTAACLLFVAYNVVILLMWNYTETWAFAAEYEEYASEFNVVKDYIAGQYASEERRILSVTSPLNEHGRTLYDHDTKEYAELPDNVKTALDTIAEKAFTQKAPVESIHVYGNRINFRTMKGYYLVYSPDEKPTWLHSPDDETDFKVKRIKDGWYHMVKD